MITFRWFGPRDPIPLEYIRQIPAVRGIVGALFDIPVGDPWPLDRISTLREDVERNGMSLAVIESIPVHEDIKLGRPTRDRLIDNYCESVRNMGRAGVPVLCYNFMPVFDWTRTELARRLDDGSAALAFDDAALAKIDLSRGTADLPGWATAYTARELKGLLDAYRLVDDARLWENLSYFLERVVPVAAASGVRMALHPDDPPWSIFGLPRIIVDGAALERVTTIVEDPANGITFCAGSLAANPTNDLPAIVRRLGAKGRIHFAHCRNIKRTGARSFQETAHPSEFGDVDVGAVLQALHDTDFAGPMRSDHGRMIWGETGQPGYGLHDRALGAMYLHGLWEGITRGQ
ncbi:MAG TPA: mannonate dehydratase [Gemmatimonadaceae bacterium]|jgi:mannonate dehydratase|nr:mannonate dehydratase [Gemmatimonadaceae bacterium]